MTRRVAVVGIDGCGKSSLITQIREQTEEARIVSVSCPDFHDSRNGPMHDLSRRLKAIGEAADEAGYTTIKAATLYLRMTLYGPVERFFLDAYDPDVLVCERHPLIETFVYGPLYARLAGAALRDSVRLEELWNEVENRYPGTRRDAERWQRSQHARVGIGEDLSTVLDDIVAVLDKGPIDAVRIFGDAYRTTLPEVVIWLDTPPAEAARRCRERGAREVHENAESLALLRENYRGVGPMLRRADPGLRFVRVENGDGNDSDRVLDKCLDLVREP